MYNTEVSVGLDGVVLRALSRDPAGRFDTGDEMAAALMQVERVAGGRQRVADFVAKLFPPSFAAVCEMCGKPAAPGSSCRECGNEIAPEVPSTQNVRIEELAHLLDDGDGGEDSDARDHPRRCRPSSRPSPTRCRRSSIRAARRRRACGARWPSPAPSASSPAWRRCACTPRRRCESPPVPRRAPRRADEPTQPIRIMPTPVPVVCPQLKEVAPVKPRDNTPTKPLPLQPHTHKVARVSIKKMPVPRAADGAAKRGEVRHGALLDPFGGDD